MKNRATLFLYILVILFSFIVFNCSQEPTNNPDTSTGLPSLDPVFQQAEYIINLTNLVVYKDSKLVKMVYDERGGPYVPVDIRSATKTITSMLIGIAIDKGYIQSVHQPISDFGIPVFDSLPNKLKNVTIHHLLTMTSGFESKEISSIYYYNLWMKAPNQVQYFVAQNPTKNPGEQFSYNSSAYHLLSIILHNSTKLHPSEFAKKYLFEPMGIGEREWEKDNQGYNNGSSGLQLSPDDMIKIGQLIINHGKYSDQQIVSSAWIDQMINSHTTTSSALPYGDYYGYGIWTGENDYGKYYFANGYGGQFIVVYPDINLVIAATNYWQGIKYSMINYQWSSTIDLIMKNIVPAF